MALDLEKRAWQTMGTAQHASVRQRQDYVCNFGDNDGRRWVLHTILDNSMNPRHGLCRPRSVSAIRLLPGWRTRTIYVIWNPAVSPISITTGGVGKKMRNEVGKPFLIGIEFLLTGLGKLHDETELRLSCWIWAKINWCLLSQRESKIGCHRERERTPMQLLVVGARGQREG